MCNCNQPKPCEQTPNICGQPICTPVQDCSCPTRLNSECVTYNGEDLECSGIESGLDLNQTLQLLDQYICDAISQINNSINLINIGTGLQIYAGIDALGRRKIRTLITEGNILTSVQNENDITFGIDKNELSNFIQENVILINVGGETEVYKGFNTLTNKHEIRSLLSSDGSVEITQNPNSIDLKVQNEVTYIESGINITVSGSGTQIDPYIINSETVDIVDSSTTQVSGDGINTPFSVEVVNLQKTINTFPYTLSISDDKHTIFVDNSNIDVDINIPDGLNDNFSAVFIQKGEGTVSIQVSGTSNLFYPSTSLQNIIKGQYYWAMIEKDTNTNNHYLLGSLKTL